MLNLAAMTENLVRGGMTMGFSWLPAVIGFFSGLHLNSPGKLSLTYLWKRRNRKIDLSLLRQVKEPKKQTSNQTSTG